jgi:hypothetical protein
MRRDDRLPGRRGVSESEFTCGDMSIWIRSPSVPGHTTPIYLLYRQRSKKVRKVELEAIICGFAPAGKCFFGRENEVEDKMKINPKV